MLVIPGSKRTVTACRGQMLAQRRQKVHSDPTRCSRGMEGIAEVGQAAAHSPQGRQAAVTPM